MITAIGDNIFCSIGFGTKQVFMAICKGLRGTAGEMIRAHFGEFLDRDSFCGYCDSRGIKYRRFTWVG